MNYKIKSANGISMISLVITIIILLIMTNMLIYNARDNVHIKNLTELYNDIELLREKISDYYNEYGKLPVKLKYTNISQLEDTVISVNNDTGDFYVIDLESMEGITLNYGKDYEKAKDDADNVDNYTDIYIINENSHNIFYVEGITIEKGNTNKTYYTDYTIPDETVVDLRYIDGILIPEKYYYIGKYADNSGNENIVISQNKDEKINSTSQTQYIWKNQISRLEDVPDSIALSSDQNKMEFLNSVNTYKGYFKNKNKTSNIDVVYNIVNEDSWSEEYTKETNFIDVNGDSVTIPEGCKISMSGTMNTVVNGLVIKDSNNNEWVWVEVPKKIFTTATSNKDYDNIKKDLMEYTKEYAKGSTVQDYTCNDEWYEGCGIDTQEEYTQMYNKMLESVYINNGFWISRYEAGIKGSDQKSSLARTKYTEITNESVQAVSQKDMIPYTYVSCKDAQLLAGQVVKDSSKTSSLPFGIQWDLTCKFIEENATSIASTNELRKKEIKEESSNIGNFKNSTFQITSSNAKQLETSEWTSIEGEKKENEYILVTTGASEQNKNLNIYDLAGNAWEWTLEKSTEEGKISVARGGEYNDDGTISTSYKLLDSLNEFYISRGFRITMY